MGLDEPRLRALFDREALIESDWYKERLRVKQQRDTALWQRHVAALGEFRERSAEVTAGAPFSIEDRIRASQAQLARVSAPSYLTELRGTIGADPLHGQVKS
jgi:hypothetical protein